MKKIIVFGGSNSSTSINKQLAIYAASLLQDVDILVLDLNDFELPLFGVDLEKKIGIPPKAQAFCQLLLETDGIILSLAENNGSYTVAFKNLLDWISRINPKLWNQKPMLLMSTSTGAQGGKSVLQAANTKFPYMGAHIIATFSLPSFNDNFQQGMITNKTINNELQKVVNQFKEAL